jgi:hypothetical protein
MIDGHLLPLSLHPTDKGFAIANSSRLQTPKATYEELVAENDRLKAEIAISARVGNTASELRPTSACSATPYTLADTLEVRIHSSHHTLRQSTVHADHDVIPVSKSSSHAIVQHGSVWTAWIHCAVHLPTFRDEHSQFCERAGGYDLANEDPSWLSIYFAFAAVGEFAISKAMIRLIDISYRSV